MPPTKIQRHAYRDWSGGWRPDKALSALAPNEMSDVLNLEFEISGGVRKRGGFEEYTNAVTDLDNGEFVFARASLSSESTASSFVQHVFFFNQSDGSIYYQTFGELEEEFADGTGTDLVDSGHSLGPGKDDVSLFRQWPVTLLTWDDNIYMTSLRFSGFSGGSGAGGTWETYDGTGTGIEAASKPIKYDVTNDTFTHPGIHDLDGTTSGFPRARTAIAYHDRIFAANVQKPNTYKHTTRIYWSEAGTSETWEDTSWIAVGADDGEEITKIIPYGEQIMIFKMHSVYALVGTDEDTFALYPLTKRLGTECTYGVDADNKFVYFFDTESSSIWSYNGAEFGEIGAPVAEHIRQNINRNASFKSMLQVVNNQLWFSYPKGDVSAGQTDENTETLVFDLRLQAWTRWDFGVVPSVMNRNSDYTQSAGGTRIEGDPNPYFVISAATQDDHIMKGYQGEVDPDATVVWTDNGTNYTFQFRTGWFSPDEGTERKRLRRLELLTAENSDQIDLDLYRDFVDAKWQELNFDPLADTSPSFLEYHFMQSSVDVTGFFNWLSIDVQATHANEAQVNQIGLRYSFRPSPRGDVSGGGYHE